MKKVISLFAFWTIVALPSLAEFPDSPEADLVLGAPDLETPGNASIDEANFDYPIGIAIDPVSGKLFVSSYTQHRILRFANLDALANGAPAEAVIGQTLFSGTDSGTTRSSLDTPLGICLDSQGRLWVAEVFNHRVLMFEDAANLPNGAEATLVLGQPDFHSKGAGNSLSQFTNPANVFVDANDNLWVCDYSNNRVLKFSGVSSLGNGAAASVKIGGYGTSASLLYHPIGAIIDSGDRLWIVEQTNNRVLRFDNANQLTTDASATVVLGQPTFSVGAQGTGASSMRVPSALAMDAEGTLWVADQWNNRLLGFRDAAAKENGAAADYLIGQQDFDSSGTGVSATRFHDPVGMGIDSAGRLWVADTENDRVVRFSPVPEPPTPPATDRIGPVLKVTSKTPRSTKAPRLRVTGKAHDPSGVAVVRYRVGKQAFRRAVGTRSWRFVAPLKRGKNSIQIVAIDRLGNTSATKTLRVTRRR